MEIVTSILGPAVVETGKLFCGSVYSRIKSTVQFQSNLSDLQNQMKRLMDLSEDVKQQPGGRSTVEVKNWLEDVVEIAKQVNSVQAAGLTADNQRLCGCFYHCTIRIRHSGKVAKLLKEVDRRLRVDNFPDGDVSVNQLAKPVEYIPGPSIHEDQTTASRNLAKLMEILDDDRYRRIGVWGMGGVGKTTLVRNLNNKLNSGTTNQSFSIVIWATVSKELDRKKVQKQIADRLMVQMEDSIERTASRLYQRLQREKKFLLILDDVWENIDLESLGIPQPEIHGGSRILLTSRFSDVCQQMMTNVEMKLNTLSDEEAWQLFSQKVGEVASLEHIKPFAEAVAKECCGLPLALIVVGTAMRGKTKVEVWKHALKELQRSVPYIRGVKDRVYNPLKWSYDSLEGNNIKACFLYCALYPEDCSIKVSELVQCWLAEGLIDEQQNPEESVNAGIAMVETLKDSCLLEEGARDDSVKMHDVVRDVAVWIASSLENECKSLSRCGIGWTEIKVSELSNSLRRVSFANNKIKELPDCLIECSRVSTCLLQDNLPLVEVPERFLQGFQALRVLNISRTRIQSLPPLQLGDLRALLLADCSALEDVAALGALKRLEVLDLCATRIRELPKEMENLINLRQVNLSRTHFLKRIQAGTLSKWTRLEVLDMTLSGYHWSTKGDIEEGQTTFEEIGCLKQLFSLSMTLDNNSCLGMEGLTWIERVGRYDFFVGPNPTANSLSTRNDERRITISSLYVGSPYVRGAIRWLSVNPSSLVLYRCDKGLNEMLQDLATSCAANTAHANNVGSFASLKSLTIINCNLQLRGNCDAPCDLLPNLEELRLENLSDLESISQSFGHLGLKFSKIKLIEVSRCPQMIRLLAFGNSFCTLPNVETLKVTLCYRLEELFHFNLEYGSRLPPIVPKLRRLELKNLPRLRNLCRPRESWPSLEHVDVIDCGLLRKLPLTLQNERTIVEIRGESLWWSRLEFDRQNIKSTLQHYFRPYSFQNTGTTEVLGTHIFTSVLNNDADPVYSLPMNQDHQI